MASTDIIGRRKYPFLPPDPQQGWLPYMWLLYLLNFILPVVLSSRSTTRDWLLMGTGVAIFLPLYFRSYWEEGRGKFLIAAAEVALALALGSWNPGACVFVIYAVAAVVHQDNPRVVWPEVVALLAVTGLASWLLHFTLWFWITAIGFSIFLAAFISEGRRRNRLNRRLGLAEDEIGRLAQIAERERIARDLHDLLGHTLSVIVLKSELAAKLAEREPERAVSEIRDVERISRDALSQVRAAVSGYRSSGLKSELDHAREALCSAGIELDVTIDTFEIPPSQENVIAMAIREAVTNVVRHSRAKSCRLILRQRHFGSELEIIDDGQGGSAPEGFGISGMRERVEALGGTLERDGSEGMRLILRLPFNTAASTV